VDPIIPSNSLAPGSGNTDGSRLNRRSGFVASIINLFESALLLVGGISISLEKFKGRTSRV
jgi:hypothetical protein